MPTTTHTYNKMQLSLLLIVALVVRTSAVLTQVPGAAEKMLTFNSTTVGVGVMGVSHHHGGISMDKLLVVLNCTLPAMETLSSLPKVQLMPASASSLHDQQSRKLLASTPKSTPFEMPTNRKQANCCHQDDGGKTDNKTTKNKSTSASEAAAISLVSIVVLVTLVVLATALVLILMQEKLIETWHQFRSSSSSSSCLLKTSQCCCNAVVPALATPTKLNGVKTKRKDSQKKWIQKWFEHSQHSRHIQY